MRSIIAFSMIFALMTSVFSQKSDSSNGSVDYFSGGNGSAQAPDAFYFSAGTGVLDNLKAQDWAFQFAAGKQWSVNQFFATKSVLEATTDFKESALASALIGGNIYPVKAIVSPYIGAGAGLGWARASNDSDVFGFDMSGTFGLMMLQNLPVKIKLETNANFLFRELINEKMPMTFTTRIGVLF